MSVKNLLSLFQINKKKGVVYLMLSDFARKANSMLQSAAKALDQRRKMHHYELHEAESNNYNYDDNFATSSYRDLSQNRSYSNEVNVGNRVFDQNNAR